MNEYKTIQDCAINLICKEGNRLTNKQIAEKVRKTMRGAKTTWKCIAFYKSKIKRGKIELNKTSRCKWLTESHGNEKTVVFKNPEETIIQNEAERYVSEIEKERTGKLPKASPQNSQLGYDIDSGDRHIEVKSSKNRSDRSHQHPQRKPQFFVVTIGRYFEFRPDWYRRGEVRDLVLEYYVVLRSVLRSHPHLRGCLKRCGHCNIFFLTHPRNAERDDLRCPFGCKEAHRKQCSTQRSVAYYHTKGGKLKKSVQNGKRRKQGREPDSEKQPAADEGKWNAPIVEHVRMVTSLIEERKVRLDEILKMLAKVLRQHSIGRGKRIDYIVRYLNKSPP